MGQQGLVNAARAAGFAMVGAEEAMGASSLDALPRRKTMGEAAAAAIPALAASAGTVAATAPWAGFVSTVSSWVRRG